jgi:hypothetical protein
MKTFTVIIGDDTYKEIRSAMFVRGISGNAYGTLDSFVYAFVEKVDRGDDPVTFFAKEDPEKPQ